MTNGELALNSAARSSWSGQRFLIAAKAASTESRFVTSQANGAACGIRPSKEEGKGSESQRGPSLASFRASGGGQRAHVSTSFANVVGDRLNGRFVAGEDSDGVVPGCECAGERGAEPGSCPDDDCEFAGCLCGHG